MPPGSETLIMALFTGVFMALALLMGLKKYDANKKTAYDLEIEDKLESVYQEILDILSEEFYLSKSQAYDILSLSGGDYTKKVNEIANK